MSTAVSSQAASPQAATGPRTEQGKAVASRNATTHGLFARDVVLPALGEDPEGYRQLHNAWIAQLAPANLLERHYVEKIAAASWRLRRLHRWQAQLFEDDTLPENERLDRLDKVLRHETALHRQIDTAVKMLGKDVPQLYARRVRDGVMLDLLTSERECRDNARDDWEVEMETRGRLRRIQKETEAAVGVLSQAALDTEPASVLSENCQNEPAPPLAAEETEEADQCAEGEDAGGEEREGGWEARDMQKRQNEPGPDAGDARRAFLASFPTLTGRGGSYSPLPLVGEGPGVGASSGLGVGAS